LHTSPPACSQAQRAFQPDRIGNLRVRQIVSRNASDRKAALSCVVLV
jgi:hypothetical protein